LVHGLVDSLHAPVSEFHVPTGFREMLLWILLLVSAGLCEEIVFRGSLQRQFHAGTRSVAAAVVLQGVVFGLGHTYQGWGQAIVISVLGMLYGILVAWRRNLHACRTAHAWSDIFESYLRFL
jgi:membrane protease YdiL (CAAX protease family)